MDSLPLDVNFNELIGPVIKWLREIGFAFSGPPVNWTFGQIGVIFLAWLIALMLNRRLSPACEKYLQSVAGSPGLVRLLFARH